MFKKKQKLRPFGRPAVCSNDIKCVYVCVHFSLSQPLAHIQGGEGGEGVRERETQKTNLASSTSLLRPPHPPVPARCPDAVRIHVAVRCRLRKIDLKQAKVCYYTIAKVCYYTILY